ncbi:MAG: DUF4239 domain-containing protein [Acetobacteraceae bacterium]|nr:DUF4239 domain-containing protein [Acetobacteraceae bacterium]
MSLFVDWLDDLPLWLSALILVGGATCLATYGPVAVRRRIELESLTTNNEVAGFKFATLGAVYAVLLAFAVFVVWETFRDAALSVTHEAGSAASIYRLAAALDQPEAGAIRGAIEHYLRSALLHDWPAMARTGLGSAEVNRALSELYAVTLAWTPDTTREEAILAGLVDQLDSMTQARRERLGLAPGVVPDIIWVSLFAGAALTISFTFFFATRNLRAQMMMSGMLGFALSLSLLVVICLDRPFAGSVQVSPRALAQVLADFGGG